MGKRVLFDENLTHKLRLLLTGHISYQQNMKERKIALLGPLPVRNLRTRKTCFEFSLTFPGLSGNYLYHC